MLGWRSEIRLHLLEHLLVLLLYDIVVTIHIRVPRLDPALPDKLRWISSDDCVRLDIL